MFIVNSVNTCKTTFSNDFTGYKITHDCMALIPMHCPFNTAATAHEPCPLVTKAVKPYYHNINCEVPFEKVDIVSATEFYLLVVVFGCAYNCCISIQVFD